MRTGAKVGLTIATFVTLVGGYLVADMFDLVPGMLTLAPPHAHPAPFPTARGALPGEDLTTAFTLLPTDAPQPPEEQLQHLVTRLAADERLGGHVGIVVADVATGQWLASANPDSLFVPASTQKVLTAVAVHHDLDPEARLATTVLLDEFYHAYLVGGGDMLIGPDAGDPTSVLGHAGLADLADQVAEYLQAAGRSVVGLTLVDDLFTGPAIPAEVPEADVFAGHTAPVAALAVNIGARNEDMTGQRAADPALQAAYLFGSLLHERGIQLVGGVGRAAAPADGREIARIESATIGEISAWTQLRSDNPLTEVLGRLVAIERGHPATGAGAIYAVLESVSELGVDVSAASLVDLSGLGRGSLLPPRLLMDTLLATTTPEHSATLPAFSDQPVCGLSGTLSGRCGPTSLTPANPARGVARAKTGALPGVRGLTGTVLTVDGRLLAFTIHADQFEQPAGGGAQNLIDWFVGQLAALDDPEWEPQYPAPSPSPEPEAEQE
ncbi:MAG: D-alanyl-D-alanine carboxypeptidase [Promicromonosporaceae bacterium]|nr:D-alanyl-D-alanine carboxypeptidase [Promicromonosporaceae bacterium]